jgi:cell wall assembly regulator SMI1
MSYDRLERWLAAFRPQILTNLQPPADDGTLATLEARIGASLPSSFLDLYRWRNGQRDPRQSGPFYGLAFLSIADVLEQWESWNQIIADEPDLVADGSSVEPGVVKELYANRLWIPFVHDWGGNHIGVDLDPGPNGRVGQVINFGRDEDTKYVLGKTVDDFVDRIATELEAGNFILDDLPDDGFETRDPATSHFLDSARTWFGAE